MPEFVPYHIIHVNLKYAGEVSSQLKRGKGNYLVFWWDEIPLGHYYLRPDEQPSADELKVKTKESIFAAIKYHSDKAKADFSFHQATDINFPSLEPILSHLKKTAQSELPDEVDLSVIICTRNRAQYIPGCLNSLLSMKVRPKEIIVVDNAPIDESTKKIVNDFPGIIYVMEPRPGLDNARNKGVKTATSEIIAYVDDDVIVHSLWAYQMYQAFNKQNIGAVTGLVFASELASEAQLIFEKHWSFNRGYVPKVFTPHFLKKQSPAVWEIGAGANMAFRRSVFSTAGLFDERLDAGAAGCNGDSEMWFRVLLKGYEIHYNPLAVVYHEHRKDLPGLKKQLHSYMRGFTVAALIQSSYCKQTGYKKHLFFRMPYYYFKLAVLGFPKYPFRFKTLFNELAGIISGVFFYWRNRKKKAYDATG